MDITSRIRKGCARYNNFTELLPEQDKEGFLSETK